MLFSRYSGIKRMIKKKLFPKSLPIAVKFTFLFQDPQRKVRCDKFIYLRPYILKVCVYV